MLPMWVLIALGSGDRLRSKLEGGLVKMWLVDYSRVFMIHKVMGACRNTTLQLRHRSNLIFKL